MGTPVTWETHQHTELECPLNCRHGLIQSPLDPQDGYHYLEVTASKTQAQGLSDFRLVWEQLG